MTLRRRPVGRRQVPRAVRDVICSLHQRASLPRCPDVLEPQPAVREPQRIGSQKAVSVVGRLSVVGHVESLCPRNRHVPHRVKVPMHRRPARIRRSIFNRAVQDVVYLMMQHPQLVCVRGRGVSLVIQFIPSRRIRSRISDVLAPKRSHQRTIGLENPGARPVRPVRSWQRILESRRR